MEEGGTLSETMLPFLNKVDNYDFLEDESTYIMSKFVRSLTDHIIDIESKVEKGFILCSLKYDHSRLR